MKISELKNSKFFIMDKDRRGPQSIAVESESDHGYRGYSFVQENDEWNISPFYIAKTFIEIEKDRYDFTVDFDMATKHASLKSSTP